MVKGYDPTRTDPSKIVLEYLLRWLSKPYSLSLQQAGKYTKFWLKKSASTSETYKKFDSFSSDTVSKPIIILKKKCTKYLGWSNFNLLFKSETKIDEQFPAYTQNNKIVVCLNFISHKMELKQNIDRQLAIYLKTAESLLLKLQNQAKISDQSLQTIDNQVQSRDKQLMLNLYEGCRQGYRNYMLEKQVQQRISKKCAKYLFFRRCERQLPWDAKFRYASKIIEQVI